METRPALIIMAAGIGSRYGGLKQIDPIGPGGEIIIDYSIYDALKAGFGKIVFVIKKEIKNTFRSVIGKKIEKLVDVSYVLQDIDDIPENLSGLIVPPDRKKPWGTGHAVLCCRNFIDTPFGVINADDFYGSSSFKVLADFLKKVKRPSDQSYQFAMAGFYVENTLTEHGYVARGVCSVDDGGFLSDIKERTRIEKSGDGGKYTEDGKNWVEIPRGTFVSMNSWGFTTEIFQELEARFVPFFDTNKDNILKAEYFLPDVVGALIAEKKARVRVLPSSERWYGVTYQEDKPIVKQAIYDMVKMGIYPEKLWDS